MKKLLVLSLFLAFSLFASAATYYISSSGNDAANGTSTSTPWRSIGKVNSMFSSFMAGDRILFRRGDTFYGQLNITRSGVAGNPITVGAYGTGEKPVITGFTTLSSWKNEGNGIYSKVINTQSAPEMVVIGGVQYGMGRWPNTSWGTVGSSTGDNSITDAALNSSVINWTGAELVQRKPNGYTIDRNKITSHTAQTLYYSGSGNAPPRSGYGYFIQNDIRTLDSFGEWYYRTSTSTFYMYFGSGNPDLYIVKLSTVSDLITFSSNVAYILFDNIALIGANRNAFNMSSNNYITIQNCDINFSGYNGIRGYVVRNFTAINNNIKNSNDLGIFLNGWYCHNAIIKGNIISNAGLIMGVGACLNNSGNGMSVIASDNSIIENNEIYDVGYNGVNFAGSNVIVRNNFINRFCLRKDDGAGIYYGAADAHNNLTITNNIVLNGIGAPGGKPLTAPAMAAGIYIDYKADNGIIISNNSVANCSWIGIHIHASKNIEILNNTVYNCGNIVRFQGAPDITIRGIDFKNNILIAKDASQLVMKLNSSTDDFDKFGTFDYNYYARPIDDTRTFDILINWGVIGRRNFEFWQTTYGHDPNSKKSPIAIKSTSDIDFFYNETDKNKVIALARPMIDIKGTKYTSNITLLPLTSAVLMVDPNPSSSQVPVYVSSVIESFSPDILEMSYDINLANIVPDISAFSLWYNSSPRSIKSIAISGNKVLITLPGPISYGSTVVTVAYTRPASNPLQSTSGGLAETLSAQLVTNKVGSATPVVSVPVYVSSVIESFSPDILEMSYDINLANIVPDISAFSLWYNSSPRSIKSIAISGNKVLITLPGPIQYGSTVVTVAYTRPASNPLQSTSGGLAANLSAQLVSNNVGSATPVVSIPVYVSSVIESFSPDIIEMSYDINLANIVPDISAFSLWYNSSPRSIKSIAISGNKVLITLPAPIQYSSTNVSVAYTRPATNPLQSTSGGLAATLSAQLVTNRANTHKSAQSEEGQSNNPVYLGSVIENSAPDILDIIYNVNLSNTVPEGSAFNVLVNGLNNSVNRVTVSGNKISLNMENTVVYGDIVTVAYAEPENNPVQTISGETALSFAAKLVENNCLGFSNSGNISVYPNPAREFISISILKPSLEPQNIQIYDFSGRLWLVYPLNPEINNIQIPLSLKSGVYFVKVVRSGLTLFSQQLIIVE